MIGTMFTPIIPDSEADGKFPSPRIWSDMPMVQSDWEYGQLARVRDDFCNFGTDEGGWYDYTDTGNTVTQLATEEGGVVRLSLDATDNDESWLISGNNTAGFMKITAGKKFAFEARVRVNQIVDQALFVGLCEEAFAASDGFTDDSGVLADKDYIGFRVLTAAPAGLDTATRTSGDAAETVIQDGAQTLVAGTWYKLGMKCDGTTITFYVDGVALGTTTTTAGTGVPDGEELAVAFGLKNGTAAARTMDVDWVLAAGERS